MPFACCGTMISSVFMEAEYPQRAKQKSKKKHQRLHKRPQD
jgi:hypothetical protein